MTLTLLNLEIDTEKDLKSAEIVMQIPCFEDSHVVFPHFTADGIPPPLCCLKMAKKPSIREEHT